MFLIKDRSLIFDYAGDDIYRSSQTKHDKNTVQIIIQLQKKHNCSKIDMERTALMITYSYSTNALQ